MLDRAAGDTTILFLGSCIIFRIAPLVTKWKAYYWSHWIWHCNYYWPAQVCAIVGLNLVDRYQEMRQIWAWWILRMGWWEDLSNGYWSVTVSIYEIERQIIHREQVCGAVYPLIDHIPLCGHFLRIIYSRSPQRWKPRADSIRMDLLLHQLHPPDFLRGRNHP